ncbi:MAG: helix-turn-helix domain-containing protein, partial [Synergistaceae bacterium]|nr:helix-turn-helix domain-containing protein [Synergistaceae bacterium]
MGRVLKVPPGRAIEEILIKSKKMTKKEISHRLGLTIKDVDSLINGEKEITHELAMKLEAVLGISAEYWEAREKMYREYIKKL